MLSLIARPRWALMALLLVAVLSVTSAQEGGRGLPEPLAPQTIPDSTPEPQPTNPDLITLPDTSTPGVEVETGPDWSRSIAPSTSQSESGTDNAPRDPAGLLESTTQGFDIVGAYPWHLAGYRGAGIKIALLDFGFGGSTTINPNRQPELVCLASFPNISFVAGFGAPAAGDTGRGLTTAEILCDLAPESDVSLYKITSAGRLHDAIVNASSTGHQVILINVDYGASFSPGDGTFGRATDKDVYAALTAAKAAGSTIIVAAGNTGTSYKTFTYGGGASNIAITAQPGDTVDISWNDWDSVPNSGGAREDLTVSLVGDGFSPQGKPARAGGLPAYQWTVPASCTIAGGNCQNLRLEFSGPIIGDAANLVVQVSVGGIGRSLGDPSGGGLIDIAGSLTRPADSPDVITVGAVCSDRAGGFQRLTYSATGPVFAAGGNTPGLPLDPFPANAIKPEVVAPSQVNTFNNRINNIAACTEGFGGTQPAAAHVAGMAALLRQNDTNANITLVDVPQPNLLTYLRTHSIDLPLDFGNGYDFEYGAGLSVLGRPSYDNDPQLEALPAFPAPDRIPAGLCTGSDVNPDAGDILYVGPDTSGDAKNGTLTAPYNSLSYAARLQAEKPTGNLCVIVLPGELVTPFYFNQPQGVNIFAYNSVSSGGYDATEVTVNNVYEGRENALAQRRRAGIVVENTDNWRWQGFSFTGSTSYFATSPRPQVIALDDADNAVFANNAIRAFPTNLQSIALVEVFNGSNGVQISDNSIRNIRGSSMPGLIIVQESGTALDPVVINNNEIVNNENNSGLWVFAKSLTAPFPPINAVIVPFVPIIHTLDSHTRIQSNTFTGNSAEALIQFATRSKSATFVTAVVGNVIVNNTIRTSEDNSASLIHGFHGPLLYVINNTIANNDVQSASPYNSIIGRGDNDDTDTINGFEWNGSLTSSDARFEVHGNFIYNNGQGPLTGDYQFTGIGCDSISNPAPNDDAGARHNWLYGLTSNVSAGTCTNSFSNPGNANVTKNPLERDGNGQPIPSGQYIQGGPDDTEPLYYAFIGNPTEPNGVDDGFDSLVTGTFPDFAAGRDARGVPRRTDGDGNSSILIDIGAFETPGPGFVFSQVTPPNGAVLSNLDTPFVWSQASLATSYTVEFRRVVGDNPITVLTLSNLTAAASDDELFCDGVLGCTLTLNQTNKDILLNSGGGSFRWTAYASDGVALIPAGNSPFRFTLPDGIAVPILNPGFEIRGQNAKFPANWTFGSKQGPDRRRCGLGLGANGSNCSVRLGAAPNVPPTVLRQIIRPANPGDFGERGDTMTLTAYIRRNRIPADVGIVRAVVIYAPGNKDNIRIRLPAGGRDQWEADPYSASIVLRRAPIRIKMVLILNGTRGTIHIDDVSLTYK